MGVGGGTTNLATLRLAGVAGMVGGALSMAVSAWTGATLGREFHGNKGTAHSVRLPGMRG